MQRAGGCREQMILVGNPQGPKCLSLWPVPSLLRYQLPKAGQKCRFLGADTLGSEVGLGRQEEGWTCRRRAWDGTHHGGGSHRARTFGLAMAFELPSQDCVKGEMSSSDPW